MYDKLVANTITLAGLVTESVAVFVKNGKFQDEKQDGSAAAVAAPPASNEPVVDPKIKCPTCPAAVVSPARTCTCTVALECEMVKDGDKTVDGPSTDAAGKTIPVVKVPKMICDTPQNDFLTQWFDHN